MNNEIETNSLSDYGSFVHEILEKFYKNEIEQGDLLEAYINGFDENVQDRIIFNFDRNVKKDFTQNYYDKGYNYFLNFTPFDEKVLGVEEEFTTDFGDFSITGYIDLLLEDKDGNIIMVDHKSSKQYDKRQLLSKIHQMYLYSAYVCDKYKKTPHELWYNFFNDQKILKIPFDEESYKSAILWGVETVENIRNATEYMKNTDNKFFCYTLCGSKKECNL